MVEKGIILYDIEMDGCLNGVFTNENANPAGTIYNEIAKRTDGKRIEDGIEGNYVCSWVDLNNERVNGLLNITEDPVGLFTFIWTSTHGNFTGTGFQMNRRQIAVHYRSTP